MAERKKASAAKAGQQEERQPYRVRLPGFVKDKEVGLGDVIKLATYSVGSALAAAADAGRRH